MCLGRATAAMVARARATTAPSPLHEKEKEAGVPFAGELFGLEEAELLGRGKKDAEQKRGLTVQKCGIVYAGCCGRGKKITACLLQGTIRIQRHYLLL